MALKRGWVLSLLAAVLLSCVCSFNGEFSGSSAPILAWSNRQLLSEGAAASTVYEVAKTDESASQLVLSALGKGADLAVVFLGKQVDASTLRQAGHQGNMFKLQGMLDAAQSSLVLPYLRFQGSSLLDSLRSNLQAAGVSFEEVGCSAESSDAPAAIQQVMGQQGAAAAAARVVLVCSAEALHGEEGSLQAELDQLAAVQAAVEQSAGSRSSVLVYASQRQDGSLLLEPQQRRGLQAASKTYPTCDALCQTQTRWLEGMIALLFIALATAAGLTCLNALNTPSRFESNKPMDTVQ